MEQLCSSVTSFLDDERSKADTALKNCKKNCGWKKRKDDLIAAARKKAKESCAKGEASDINDLNKGLDTDAKARLKSLYDRNSRIFDGTAKLAAKDFDVKSDQSPASTGKGGRVTDLKASEPAIPKLNTASEFSLSGIKPSGETPGQSVTKQSSALLALASSAKSPVATAALASSAKSAADTTASAAENQSPTKSQLASSADENYKPACLQALKLSCGCTWGGVCTPEALKCFEEKKETCRISGCSAGYIMTTSSGCCLTSQVTTTGICCSPGRTPAADGTCGCVVGYFLTKNQGCVKICNLISDRIEWLEKTIAGLKQGKTPKQTNLNAQPAAKTTCRAWWRGAKVDYYPVFKELPSDLQDAIKAHEDVHVEQCNVKYGWWGEFFLNLTGKGYVLDIPAYGAEQSLLQGRYDVKCKSK